MTDDITASDADSIGLDPAEQRRAVRRRYAEIAAASTSDDDADSTGDDDASSTACGTTKESTVCGTETDASEISGTDRSRLLGYSPDDVDAVATGANLGLGCGNPTAIASLEPGETVLDLGSGAGFDCFLAAREVGDAGQVIGVDMTPQMVELARENVEKNDASNVEFRLGEIEHLPAADESVDVIVSNCVVNLSPDKSRVFREAYRVLRPGGRLAISDVVLTADVPAEVRNDPSAVAGCVGDAASIPDLEAMLDDAGFVDVTLEPKAESDSFVRDWDDERDPSEFLVSARIEGRKPPQ